MNATLAEMRKKIELEIAEKTRVLDETGRAFIDARRAFLAARNDLTELQAALRRLTPRAKKGGGE